MKRLLQIKDLPFLITLLFTLAGWTFMKLSTSTTSSPIVEYKWVNVETHGDTTFGYCRLINLTNDKRFDGPIFQLNTGSPEADIQFTGGILDAVPPAPQHSSKPEISLYTIRYRISEFNPKEEYHLSASVIGKKVHPSLSIFQAQEIIRIKKSSFFTFLIRNEEYVYLIAFAIILILIGLYFLTIKVNTTNQ